MNWPLDPTTGQNEPTITQLFGENPDDYTRWGYPGHNGLDLWTDHEPQMVYTIDKGIVEKVGWEGGGYGKYVVVLHEGGWRSYYAHLNQVHVLPGNKLPASAAIGLMGSTGFSSGPHLHLGIRYQTVSNPPYKGYVDPLPLLRGGPITINTGREYEQVTFYPTPAAPPKMPATKLPGIQPAVFVSKRGNKTMYRMRRYF